MFPDPAIKWDGFRSEIDGINSPNLSVLYGACGDKLGLVVGVSEWRNKQCLKSYTVRFSDPIAWFAVDEMVYSIADTGSLPPFPRKNYVQQTQSSILMKAVEKIEIGILKKRVKHHFLLVGLNTCLEVLSTEQPTIQRHTDDAGAEEWVRARVAEFA